VFLYSKGPAVVWLCGCAGAVDLLGLALSEILEVSDVVEVPSEINSSMATD